MTVDGIDEVAVLGAGSMGHGIAEVAAIAGYEVILRDIEEDLVADGYEQIEWSLGKLEEKGQIDETADAVLARIETAVDLETAVGDVDLVIEAVPEQLELKREVFGEVDAYAKDEAILASNTSSLRITEIAEAVDAPERLVGMHFFNPVVKMDLVEVVHGESTRETVADTAAAFVESIDKTPIHVRKDVRGFVVNSVLVPFMEEAAWMLADGEATVRQADAAMVYNRGYPMGPFELNDLGGIDIAYHFFDEADEEVPPPIAEKVDAGDLGRKTGRGFYDYENGDGVDFVPEDGSDFDALRIESRMVNEAAKLVGNDVATPADIDIALRLGGRFPEGICQKADKIGLDVVLETLESLRESTGNDRFAPAEFLDEQVANGNTGRDAGVGFYDYRTDPPYHFVDYELEEEGVLRITLDRPERMNAFAPDMFDELARVFDTVDVEDVACVVFEGAGERAFSAGADITAFTTADPIDLMDPDKVFGMIAEYDRPTIAKIDGFCLGAGFELMLCCDLRIATHGSRLGTPETNLGVVPGGGATQRLPRIVSDVRAKELIFRGEDVGAERAEDWGLINRAVDPDELDATVEAFVADLVDGPPVALKVAKHLINEGQDASLDTGLTMESRSFGVLASTEDMLEGIKAFREDRDPDFHGR